MTEFDTPHFNAWWQRRGETVEAFNEHRNGESGVEKLTDPDLGTLYVKRQRGFLYRSLRYPFGRPTVIREQHAIHAFSQLGIHTPEIVFGGAEKDTAGWRGILVTKELSGYSDLASWYQQGGRERLGPDAHQQFLTKLAVFVASFHKQRWRHASLYFKHIFVTPGSKDSLPDIALLDLEKAHRTFTRQRAAQRDLAQLRSRAPLIHGKPVLDETEWSQFFEQHRQALLR